MSAPLVNAPSKVVKIHSLEKSVMGIRPRTKLVLQRKAKRCAKCNCLVRMRKTCKRCGSRQRA